MIYGSRKRMTRHYVRVVALHELDGHLVPLQILWDDFRRFDVSVIGHPRRERTLTHGFAIRHDVMIGGQRRILWHDNQGWFVEVPEDGNNATAHGTDPRCADVPC